MKAIVYYTPFTSIIDSYYDVDVDVDVDIDVE
jgi:hypothetical protein